MTYPSIVDQNANIPLLTGDFLDSIGITLIKWIFSYVDRNDLGFDVGIFLFDFRLKFDELGLGSGDEDEIEAVLCKGEGEGFADAGGGSCDDCVCWTITFAELFDLNVRLVKKEHTLIPGMRRW
jgi:hypothetical protein